MTETIRTGVWPFAIASVLGALLCFLGTRSLARITKVPFAVLGPFLIGFVLAVPLERYYFLTDSVYDGADRLLRPWVLVFVAPAQLGLLERARARRRLDADDGHHQPPVEAEGELAGMTWSLVTAAGGRRAAGPSPPPPRVSTEVRTAGSTFAWMTARRLPGCAAGVRAGVPAVGGPHPAPRSSTRWWPRCW